MYFPAIGVDCDPDEELEDFWQAHSFREFEYAMPDFASFTRNSLDTQRVEVLYSVEAERRRKAAWEEFDKKWKKKYPNAN
jgi:hypothetical protein